MDIKKIMLTVLCLMSKTWCSERSVVMTRLVSKAQLFAFENSLTIEIPENYHEQLIGESTKHEPDQPTMKEALAIAPQEEQQAMPTADTTQQEEQQSVPTANITERMLLTFSAIATSPTEQSWLAPTMISRNKRRQSFNQKHGQVVESKPYVKPVPKSSAFDVKNARATNPW